jgi:hypothetical protein
VMHVYTGKKDIQQFQEKFGFGTYEWETIRTKVVNAKAAYNKRKETLLRKMSAKSR